MLASVTLKEEPEIRIGKQKTYLGIIFICICFIGNHVFNGLANGKQCLEYRKWAVNVHNHFFLSFSCRYVTPRITWDEGISGKTLPVSDWPMVLSWVIVLIIF